MRALDGRSIVFVNNFPGPGLGGGEAHLLTLVRACTAAGMNVHVICQRGSDMQAAAIEAGAAVAPYAMGGANVMRTASRIRKYCRRYDAAVLHTTGYFTNLLGRLAKRGGRPVLVNTVHIEPSAPLAAGGSRAAQAVRDALDRATAKRVDLVLPVSQAIADRLAGLGYDPARVQVIHNGIDTAEVHRLSEGPAGLPPSVRDGGPLVGLVARLEAVKSAGTFVRAAALVAAARPDARFVIAGDGPERAEIEALAASLGLGERIAFLGWVDPIEPVVAALDVLALTSLSEGFPMVLLEAMTLGKPAVAASVGGVPEIVVDGATGVLFPAGDAEAAAASVLRLLDDPALRARMGVAARHRIVDGFSVGVMTSAHMAAYRRLIDRAETARVRE